MIFRSDASHNFRIDKTIRFGTDSVFKKITHPEYTPVPPPIEGYLLEYQGGGVPFLLYSGDFLTLL